MEFDTLYKPILGGLGHSQIAALEDIIKGHGGRAASDHGHALHILWQIAVNALLGDCVDAGDQAVHKDGAIFGGGDSALHLLAGDGEADTGHHAVLRSLFQIKVTGGRLHIQIGVHGISVLHAGHNILQVGITIGDQFGAGADGGNVVSAGCDRHRAVEGIIGRKGQRVPGLGNGYLAVGAGEIKLGQNSVRIREGKAVFSVLILQILRGYVGRA